MCDNYFLRRPIVLLTEIEYAASYRATRASLRDLDGSHINFDQCCTIAGYEVPCALTWALISPKHQSINAFKRIVRDLQINWDADTTILRYLLNVSVRELTTSATGCMISPPYFSQLSSRCYANDDRDERAKIAAYADKTFKHEMSHIIKLRLDAAVVILLDRMYRSRRCPSCTTTPCRRNLGVCRAESTVTFASMLIKHVHARQPFGIIPAQPLIEVAHTKLIAIAIERSFTNTVIYLRRHSGQLSPEILRSITRNTSYALIHELFRGVDLYQTDGSEIAVVSHMVQKGMGEALLALRSAQMPVRMRDLIAVSASCYDLDVRKRIWRAPYMHNIEDLQASDLGAIYCGRTVMSCIVESAPIHIILSAADKLDCETHNMASAEHSADTVMHTFARRWAARSHILRSCVAVMYKLAERLSIYKKRARSCYRAYVNYALPNTDETFLHIIAKRKGTDKALACILAVMKIPDRYGDDVVHCDANGKSPLDYIIEQRPSIGRVAHAVCGSQMRQIRKGVIAAAKCELSALKTYRDAGYMVVLPRLPRKMGTRVMDPDCMYRSEDTRWAAYYPRLL